MYIIIIVLISLILFLTDYIPILTYHSQIFIIILIFRIVYSIIKPLTELLVVLDVVLVIWVRLSVGLLRVGDLLLPDLYGVVLPVVVALVHGHAAAAPGLVADAGALALGPDLAGADLLGQLGVDFDGLLLVTLLFLERQCHDVALDVLELAGVQLVEDRQQLLARHRLVFLGVDLDVDRREPLGQLLELLGLRVAHLLRLRQVHVRHLAVLEQLLARPEEFPHLAGGLGARLVGELVVVGDQEVFEVIRAFYVRKEFL